MTEFESIEPAVGRRRNARASKTTSRSPILSYAVQHRRCHE